MNEDANLIPEDEFEQEYKPTGSGGNLYVTWEEAQRHDIHHVWTVVDAEGNLYAVPGFHVVDRIEYIVTEKPWVTGEELAEWVVFAEGPDEDETGAEA